jgi:hypothetical protein
LVRRAAIALAFAAAWPLIRDPAGAQGIPPARVSDSVRRADSLLTWRVDARIDGKAEKAQNLRCVPAQLFNPAAGCVATFLYNPGAEWTLKSSGYVDSVGRRWFVDVDFDSQREFDASNSISVLYRNPAAARLKLLEIGNVSFQPFASRFLSANLQSGNYGAQVVSKLGPVELRAIGAQQKGNPPRTIEFLVGERAVATSSFQLEDYQVERLRFFFTVDPALFVGHYPNIDILDRFQLSRLRAQLPDTIRPTRVRVYRYQSGSPPRDPNGPSFRLNGDAAGVIGTSFPLRYDLLQEGVDYVMDPSQLWFALTLPLNPLAERLVVAYYVTVGGREQVWRTTGGTPDVQATDGNQVANLVWDGNAPTNSRAFRSEIRSVYRIGGEELVRSATRVRIVSGAGNQERPVAGPAKTWLEMFGLARANNDAEFDAENRLWPRAGDPIDDLTAGAGDVTARLGAPVFREHYLVFPSLRPFALRDSGLIDRGNPANPAIYTLPAENLDSPQHPASIYRLNVETHSMGGELAVGDGLFPSLARPTTISLGAVQLRRGSERVSVDDRVLVRDRDYRIDYDLGTVSFVRADTLFPRPRRVTVRYEDNVTFVAKPTTLAGLFADVPLGRPGGTSGGALTFTALQQAQRTAFTRPELGFQAASTFMAGATGRYTWELPGVSRWLNTAVRGLSSAPSRIAVRGELVASLPQVGGEQARPFVHDFEGEDGFNVSLIDSRWYTASLPAYGSVLRAKFGSGFFEPERAAPIAWQTNALGSDGQAIQLSIREIDPQTATIGTGFSSNETMLWLTLHPLAAGGFYNARTGEYDWTVPGAPSGPRFRSVRTVLAPQGVDLSRSEFLDMWTLVDTSAIGRAANPTLVLDLGRTSENSLAFAPQTLTIRPRTDGGVDSVYSGKRVQGLDRLDGERDPFSQRFNVATNDRGLPGDRIDQLSVVDASGTRTATDVAICAGSLRALRPLGDTRANCTVGNTLLDEEDLDLDQVLNLTQADRESERILRYVIDLSDRNRWTRFGGEYRDSFVRDGQPVARTRQWVLVRVPFRAYSDSIGEVQTRRMQSLRLTLVSSPLADPRDPVQIPIARLSVVGAPWTRRDTRPIAGVGGETGAGSGGYVIVSTIGTADSSGTLVYQPPPGVRDEAVSRQAVFEAGQTEINEHSLRVMAGGLAPFERAEAYYRFTGEQNFMAFRELRLWARGRNSGWGTNGELQMFVKLGRDASNFYLYRAPVSSGPTADAWNPEVRVDFNRLIELRARLEREYASGKSESIACTGLDSALVAASPVPAGGHRFAACADGYIAYTVDPASTPPNLNAVQEVAVGMIRVAASGGTSPTVPSDTLELWIDDMRLGRPVNDAGGAGEFAADITLGDFADVRMSLVSRGGNFRQLNDAPSNLDERQVLVSSTVHLEKLLPERLGVSVPLTITHDASTANPVFLQHTDVRGDGIANLRTPRVASTAVALTVRRAAPVGRTLGDLVLDHLSATSAFVTGGNRSEYHDGSHRGLTNTVEYALVGDSVRTLRGTGIRINPTQLRLTTGTVSGHDRRRAFLVPGVGGVETTPRNAIAETWLWRNGSVVELNPVRSLRLRWDASIVRDLRNYGDTNAVAGLATAARGSMFGTDVGFERERVVFTQTSFTPVVASWLTPRLELGSRYSLHRDPNAYRARGLAPSGIGAVDSAVWRDTAALFPRRVTAGQSLVIGAQFDIARAVGAVRGDSTGPTWLARVLQPIDVQVDRGLLAAYDDVGGAPGLAFQLGLVSPGTFRSFGGRPATAAGVTGNVSASNVIVLPLGFTAVNSYRRTDTRNWVRRFDALDPTEVSRVDGAQSVFPNTSITWEYRPEDQTGLVRQIAASGAYRRSAGFVSLPGVFGADVAGGEYRRSHERATPYRAAVAWGFGEMTTSANFSRSNRIDSLPGTVSRTRAEDVGGELARIFQIPEAWKLGIKNELRVRAGMQQTRTRTFVSDAAGLTTSRLRDDGTVSYRITADNDLSETATFTFQASRDIRFDNNNNRRFALTVFSTVFRVTIVGPK